MLNNLLQDLTNIEHWKEGFSLEYSYGHDARDDGEWYDTQLLPELVHLNL